MCIHWLYSHMDVVVYPHALDFVSTCKWPCIHMVIYPCTSGHVSTCRIWLCTICTWLLYLCGCAFVSTCICPWISVHVDMYPQGNVFTCMRLCLHMHNLVMHYVPKRRISYKKTLWATAEWLTTTQNHMNFIKKLAQTFQGIVKQKCLHFYLHHPRPISSLLEILPSSVKNWFCTVGHCAEWDFKIDYLSEFKVEFKQL
jgi:hypothetical protein